MQSTRSGRSAEHPPGPASGPSRSIDVGGRRRELGLIGESLFNVAFRSDELDIYHVNDALADRGWRMNGLQLPPALHFCITKPNTQPGITEAFAHDLDLAVAYAKNPPSPVPRSGAMYGSGGRTPDTEQVFAGLTRYLDAVHEVGPLA